MGRASGNKGFTLVEISMVLVIIALLAAGVLAGRGLIESANIRRVISDKERFDGAVQAFFAKYDFLPGDLKDLTLLPGAAPRANTLGHGDGDGMINNSMWNPNVGTKNTSRNQCAEALLFWSDLAVAGYINDLGAPMAQDGVAGTCVPATVTPDTGLGNLLPRSSLGGGLYWMVSRSWNQANYNSDPRLHYYILASVESLDTFGTPNNTNGNPIPGAISYLIDQKIDDGQPSLGNMVGGYFKGDTGGTVFFAVGGATGCQVSNTQYLTTSTSGCSLGFKTAW